jgi:hypothetical protein
MLQLHCEWNAGAPMLSMTMLQLARKWNADIVDAVDSTTMLQLINEWNASTPLRVKCRCAHAVLHNASTCAQVKCRHCRCRRANDISSTPCGVKCRCADAVCQRRQCFNSVVSEMPTYSMLSYRQCFNFIVSEMPTESMLSLMRQCRHEPMLSTWQCFATRNDCKSHHALQKRNMCNLLHK